MMRLACALLLLAVATSSASQSRIIGGSDTSIAAYPSVVQVESSIVGLWRQTCAGLILTSRSVLSAASCYIGPVELIVPLRRIRAGSSYRNTGGQVSGISYLVKHPSWNEGLNLEGDLAVLHLQIPLFFTSLVQQGQILAQGVNVPDNMPAVQVGWGVTLNEYFPSLFSRVLQRLDVVTVNNERCALNHANSDVLPLTVTNKMICANRIGDAGACVGSRGSPLFINNICVGIISMYSKCTVDNYPTIHTSVSSFTNWIVQNAF